jgi:hypothetical protein
VVWEVTESILGSRLDAGAAEWLRDALRDVRREDTTQALFRRHWSGAGRRLGRAPLTLSATENDLVKAGDPSGAPDGWGADECGRALLLAAALAVTPDHAPLHLALVEELVRTGELREQQAVLRCLSSLPGPERFVAIAIEAGRSNAVTLLEAIACGNPYPARFFPEAAFNQMVMKCLFNGLEVARIWGLDQRRGAELDRMVTAYASERRAAGRAVPADIARLLEGEAHASV